jgi:hypothetical protein
MVQFREQPPRRYENITNNANDDLDRAVISNNNTIAEHYSYNHSL